MTSPGPAFQECTGSCHKNVHATKAVPSDLRSTNGLTVLTRICHLGCCQINAQDQLEVKLLDGGGDGGAK